MKATFHGPSNINAGTETHSIIMIAMFLCDNGSYDNSKWFLDNVQTSLSIKAYHRVIYFYGF